MGYSTQAKNASATARVQIMTVDPVNRRVEGMQKDGSMLQIAVWDNAGNAFRWPKENEIWMARRANNVWFLDCRVQQSTNQGKVEPLPITSMAAGQMKLDSTTITDAAGNAIPGVARATATLTGNGTSLIALTIPHGLAGTPRYANAIALGWNGFFVARAAPDSVNLYLNAAALTISATAGTAVTTTAFTNLTHYSYQWVAIL